MVRQPKLNTFSHRYSDLFDLGIEMKYKFETFVNVDNVHMFIAKDLISGRYVINKILESNGEFYMDLNYKEYTGSLKEMTKVFTKISQKLLKDR